MLSANDLIKKLSLKPLPHEGGYYAETYRSGDVISGDSLPDRYSSEKALGTAIYYLLTPDTHSKLHRLPTDEIYHYYLGDPVEMLLLYPDGKGEIIILGADIEAGQHLQFVVPRGVWQGSYLIEGGRFALMGTTMAPGFDFGDYEERASQDLTAAYPQHKEFIEMLCR